MDFSTIKTPTRVNLLISFMDIQGFVRIAKAVPDLGELYELLNGWASIVITEVENVGGRVIKFIGDSALSVFPEDETSAGVHALLAAKQKSEDFLQSHGFSNRLRVTGHVGETIMGIFGTGHCVGLDLFGDSVNVSATLERADRTGQLILSPQAFRKLDAAARKAFHKHTPPVVYVAADQ
jgi:adenylate cyclase